MATLPQMERALVNAHNAGDIEAARVLAAAIQRARQDIGAQIPGTQVAEATSQPPEPGIGQQLLGAAETGLTLATGAVGGVLGTIQGTGGRQER